MQCLRPIAIKNPKYWRNKVVDNNSTFYQLVPCGKCVNCLKNKITETYSRLYLQTKVSDACFLTLTYDEQHLPEFGVSKDDVQKFFKRVRKNHYFPSFMPLKYFLISEYGTHNTHRAHYHAVVFNAPDDVLYENWHDGIVHIFPIIPERLMYVAKYHVLKNVFVPKDKNENFRLMSHGLGLDGFNFFELDNVIRNDWNFLVDAENRMRVLPRYFRKVYDIHKSPEIVSERPYKFFTAQEINDINQAIDYKTDLYIKRLMQTKQI